MRLIKLIACLSLAATCGAAENVLESASVSAPWLKFPSSARSASMAGAGAALAQGADSLLHNPAGLAFLERNQAAFMHNAWAQDAAIEHASYARGLDEASAYAASFDFLSFGAVEKVSVAGGAPTILGSFNPSAWHLDFGYGRNIAGIALGLNLKYLSQSLDGTSASAYGADLGAMTRFGDSGFSLGAAAQHFGSQLAGASLPLNIRAGLAYQVKAAESDQLSIAVDVNAPLADSAASTVAVGMEYWFKEALALRGGYKVSRDASLGGHAGLSAGIGAKYKWLALDYAYHSLGDLGAGNLVSLAANF